MNTPRDILEYTAALVGSGGSSTMTVIPGDDGWEIYSIDPAHVIISHTEIDKGMFGDYTKWDAEVTFDLDKLTKALKLTNADDRTIELTKEGRIVLSGAGMTSRFAPTAYSTCPRRVPNIPATATAEIDPVQLSRMVKAGSNDVSACLRIRIGPDGVVFSDLDRQGDGNTLTVPGDECAVLEGTAESMYPMPAMKGVAGCIPKGVTVTLRLGTDTPLVMSWGAGEKGSGYRAVWICAHQLEDDDDL